MDQNNCIDYSEFVMACMKREDVLNEEHLKQAFVLFDKDGDGSITVHELEVPHSITLRLC
jgi:Ca2+-binding EF-hand superfamily protein